MVVPVAVVAAEPGGISLHLPDGVSPPPGCRRAGLLAHSFARFTFGQNQRRHTGWLEVAAGERRALFAPHTQSGYHLPRSRLLYRVGAGFVTRRGLRQALRAGFVTDSARVTT